MQQKFVTDWNQVPVIIDIPYAARILGMNTEYVRRLSRQGLFPAFKPGGSHWRVYKDDLMKYMKANSLRENASLTSPGNQSQLQK